MVIFVIIHHYVEFVDIMSKYFFRNYCLASFFEKYFIIYTTLQLMQTVTLMLK